ncbi:MAG: TonB family protein, partial [Gammaproteobacteria bacterium]|nr:TonB family protein [Gammaproteobacteria bacterium]
GEVGRVTVLVGSGNEVFDASVEQAVRKAAPFPYPDSVELRNEVRELEMTFVHEG